MGKIVNFTDLFAWQEGHKFVLMVYKTTRTFPDFERFGLTSQLQRAVVSITSNIAEGFSRSSYKEKIQFYSMALGSLTEVQNQLIVARDINYLKKEDFEALISQSVRVHKLINSLIRGGKRIVEKKP